MNTCKERIWNGWHGVQCSKPQWKDGYCKIHHPERVTERRAKRDARWKEKEAAQREAYYQRARGTVRRFLATLPPDFDMTLLESLLATWKDGV